jgi:hypothetical protein
MHHRAKIALAHSEQHGSIEFGVAAHAVVDAGMEGLSASVEPGFLRLVSVFNEDRSARPVLSFTRQVSAALQQ